MQFTIIGEVRGVQTIAAGSGIRVLARLQRQYGLGRGRRRKGIATVQLPRGEIRSAGLRWYEATGIGRREYKIKRFLN